LHYFFLKRNFFFSFFVFVKKYIPKTEFRHKKLYFSKMGILYFSFSFYFLYFSFSRNLLKFY